MDTYYQILGVTPNATLDQIKKAYRKQAKLLHPDLNNSPNAKEDFILVNEAYEFLINTTGVNPNRFKRAQEQAEKRAKYQQQWEQKEREKARARAQEFARMKYEAYIKSDIYKTTEALNVIADFFVTIVVLLFVIGLPVLMFIEYGPFSLIICALIILPTSPLWLRFLIRTFGNMHLLNFFIKTRATIRSKIMSITILLIFNILIFFKIALNTLIEFHNILVLYAIAFIAGVIIARQIKSNYKKYLIKFNIAPGLISMLFLINYVISTNPTDEFYWYSYNYSSAPVLVTIELENNTYHKYKGIRLFISKETIHGKACIKYTFKDGLLGFKTAHSIEIHNNKPLKY